jgi:hypothetical protein
MRTKRFIVTGTMDVQGKQVKAFDGSIIGYKQKDGSKVNLIVALEIKSKQGKFRYLVTNKQMQAIGFSIKISDSRSGYTTV